MATKPTHTIYDFSFELFGFDFVVQLQLFDNKITENYDVLDIDFEGKAMFDLDYLIEHIEENLQEELYNEVTKNTESDADGKSEYQASIKD